MRTTEVRVCLFCSRTIRNGRKVVVMEQGVTTVWGYEKEMAVDAPDFAHSGCFKRMTRRYKRDTAARSVPVAVGAG